MESILGFSRVCKKYSPGQEDILKQKVMDYANKIDDLDKKYPDYRDHCRTFKDALQTVFWVFVVSF